MNLANSFSSCSVRQTTRVFLLGSTRYFGNSGASYDILSLTPKDCGKHISFFEERDHFSIGKLFRTFFVRVLECDKPQGTIETVPQVVLTITVLVIGSFL